MRAAARAGLRAAAAALLAVLLLGAPAAAQHAAEDRIPSGPSVDERLAEIRRRVQEAASYPDFARQRNLSGEVLVEFRITGDGNPEALQVRRSSGSALLDRAAERAVREAAPLPRLYGLVAVPVRFQLETAPLD